MKITSKLAVMAGVIALALPGAASAEPTQIAPPFSEAWSEESCGFSVYVARVDPPNTCTSDGNADVAGWMSVDVAVRTPLDGRAPGPVSGWAYGQLAVRADVPQVMARAFVVTVTMDVDAHGTATSRALGTPGSGSVYVDGSVYLQDGSDSDYESLDVIDARGEWAPSDRDETISMTFLVGNGHERLYSGSIFADLYLTGSAYAGGNVSLGGAPRGAASVSAGVVVTGITVQPV